MVRGEQPISPVAILTRFGCVLSSPVETPLLKTCSSNVTVSHGLKTDALLIEREDELNEQLKNFWDCEEVSVKNDNTTSKLRKCNGRKNQM